MNRILQYLFESVFPPTDEMQIVRTTTPETVRMQYDVHTRHNITALTAYRTSLIRTLIHEAKYQRNRRAFELLAVLLHDYLREKTPADALLVPIPLSRARLRERGYNQVELIARAALADLPNVSLDTKLLQKARHTPRQTTLSRKERLTNLTDAFSVASHDVPLHTPIIVLDDITTTGSTLAEAQKILREAGFTNVECVAIACA